MDKHSFQTSRETIIELVIEQDQIEKEADSTAEIEKRKGLSLRGLLQVVIGVGALFLVIMKSDARGLYEAISATRAAYLPLALLATFIVTWLMAFRWGMILKVRGRGIKAHRLFVYYLIGIFFSNFVPGGSVSGDVARLVYADRELQDKAFVLSTLVYERTVGLFVLLATGLGAMLASRATRPEGSLIYLIEGLLAMAFVALTMLMSEYVSSRLAKLSRWAGRKVKMERVGDAASRTLIAISELKRFKKMLVGTVLASVAIRVVWSLGCYVVSSAMGLPLSFSVVFAFISLVDLIRMLPISIGGLGVREWALVVLFANVGLAREQALMFSFLAFAPILLNAIAGGIIYISRAGIARPDSPIAKASAKSAGV